MFFLRQETGQHATGILRGEVSQVVVLFCHATSLAPRAPPNHGVNINRKCAPGLNPGICRIGYSGFPFAAKRFMTTAQ
jgi:hypothetical protein